MPLSLIRSEVEVASNGEFQLILEAFTKRKVLVSGIILDSLARDEDALFPECVSGSI